MILWRIHGYEPAPYHQPTHFPRKASPIEKKAKIQELTITKTNVPQNQPNYSVPHSAH